MVDYLFGILSGQELTTEPALFGVLVVYIFSTLLGAGIWYWSKRYIESNPLASKYLRVMGGTFFWLGIASLLVAGCFYQGVIFNRRAWLYFMLLLIYATIVYSLYFYFTKYQEMYRMQVEAERRRKRYVPTSTSLKGPERNKPIRQGSRRRRARK